MINHRARGEWEQTGQQGAEGEQGLPPRAARDPGQSSAQEVAEHLITHDPCRSWCPHCARGAWHKRQEPAESSGRPGGAGSVGDYCFLRSYHGENESPTLAVIVSATRLTVAHPVRRNCAGPEVINITLHDLGLVGHREVIFKTDQEPAAKLLQAEAAARRTGIMLENSSAGESLLGEWGCGERSAEGRGS